MKYSIIFAFLLSLLMGGSAYFASNNYFIAIGVTLLFLLYYFIFAHRRLSKYSKKVYRIHHCYKFINSFLITMSVRNSLEESYRSGVQGCRGELKHIVAEIENMDNEERLNYLRTYFNLSIYKMFLNVVNIYLDQGGNILDMADTLIQESTRIEDSLNKTIKSVRQNILEFIILWGLSIGILIFMRFGISSFYLQMLHSMVFLILLGVYYLIILISIHMLVVRSTELFIKEDAQ